MIKFMEFYIQKLLYYYREYFLLKNIRITFDSNIKYKNLNSLVDFFQDQETVMEVKADLKTLYQN